MEIPKRIEKLERKPAPLLVPEFGPLKRIRVLPTGSIVAGPFIGTMLADLGAEVMHVEKPRFGDAYRSLGPSITLAMARKYLSHSQTMPETNSAWA